jgi:putative CocE/NonD family hydrolase
MTRHAPRVRTALAGLSLLLCLLPLRAQTQARYQVLANKDLMIAMRDGVKLATDIYRPARSGAAVEGKFPVILERTPYGKNRAAGVANYFTPRGYVVVLQDVRARYGSEGHWRPLRDDPNDGFDTAKWIGAQPWCDGGIGTVGTSYDGGTQHAMAIANAPFLKTMIPVDAMSDIGRYGVRHNGAFELRWFNWVLTLGNSDATQSVSAAAARAASDPAAAAALADLVTHVREYVRGLPLRPGTTPLKFAPD